MAGCTCADTGALDKHFICTTTDQCAEGYFCDFTGECIRNGGSMGGGVGGGGAATGGGVGGMGGGDAGGMGGAGGGGLSADAGLQLVITSAAPSVPVGTCSMPITFEVRSGMTLAGVPGPTTVSIAATPAGALSLWRGPGCSTPAPLVLAAGASSGSFSFFAGDAGTFSLALSAVGIGGATQPATALFQAVASLAFVTNPPTVRAGECSGAIALELRDAAALPTKANLPVSISLSATPSPGLLFYTDAACATAAVTQVTVPMGASRTTFYAARATGQDYLMTAAVGNLSATRAHSILPVVRSGSCVVANGDGGVTCAVVPAVVSLTDSFLVYQVASASDVAGAVALLCELTAVGTITCQRGQFDLDAVISWQVAEVKGATVRKATTFCDGGLSVPIGAAPVGSSFVLTANQNDGNVINDSDFNLGRLNDAGTAVDFAFGGGCMGPQSMLAQVVTLPNIIVGRGTTSIASASAVRTLMDPPAPQQGVLLAQWTTPVGAPGICDRTVRPELVGASINFSRGNATASCTASDVPVVIYDKIDFRSTATVQQVLVTMGAGMGATTATLTAVDRTRTLVFAGGQGSTGQSLGEGSLAGTTNTTDFLGDVSVTLSLAGAGYQSTQLGAKRVSMLGSSKWSAYVVELIP